jgi:hypothetical protein
MRAGWCRIFRRRAPNWQVQPRRRSRYQVPGTVQCTRNLAAIRSRSSQHRAACPFDARPSAPPASQARRHRCTDRSDTPQLSGDVRDRDTPLEALHGRQPDQFPPPAALSG